MQASPARGAKRRAKALKPANPWLALPKLAALFEPSTPQNFFKGSKVPELEELALSETQLLEQTAALLGEVLQLWRRDLVDWFDAPPHAFGFGSFQMAAIRTGGHSLGRGLVPAFFTFIP
jgi:hypothetical protein